MNKKHSGFGISSFIISLANGGLTFLAFMGAGVLEVTSGGTLSENNSLLVVIGMFIILCVIISLIGLVLGIVGLLDKTKKKVFPLLGTLFNLAICLLIIATIIYGNSIK